MRAPNLPLERVAVTIQPASADWTLGRVTSAALGRDGMAYVLMRSDRAHPVIVVDRSGRVVRSWGSGMFKIPHTIRVDASGNVWTTDAGDGRVIEFSSDGKKLMEITFTDLPTGKDCVFPASAANGQMDFCGTTDITFVRDGGLVIADGYGKMRIMEYSASGRSLREWGGAGDGPSHFHVSHGLAYDGKRILYVADRDAGRIQHFDLEGRYLSEWANLGRPGSVSYRDGALWAPIRTLEPAGASTWVIKIDPASGAVLGKIETTATDFIDVGANGDVL
jgi:hypothetical protein